MTRIARIWLNAAVTAFLCGTPFALADPGLTRVSAAPESQLWIVGDSTLHPYESRAEAIEVELKIEGEGPIAGQIRAGKMKVLTVRVPVAGLKSAKAALDKNLRKALKAEQNPDILFTMDSYDVAASTAGAFPISVKGRLSVAGTERSIDLGAEVSGGETVRVTGAEEVLMTDHGVKPPSFMGAIRTQNRVVVNFDLTLK